MIWVVTICTTILLTILVLSLPSVYELSKFSKVVDITAIVAKEFITSRSIVTQYYPSANVQIVGNVAYSIDALTNTIKFKLNNIEYSYPLTDRSVILPILLGEVN